ncbi:HAD family hydrolase [Nocardioides sp. S-58]|uniref:HAD family hydrolase n=1 Tax=Nocardioides renjunii TaxID=3095075 RepID=A0ABU5KBG1_9ACTN|nr:HAD family hydrolase [Nocardioides sp. S-58]MDZ5662182.1 HAD family hydrolase [Nocardioides sp. S-58]
MMNFARPLLPSWREGAVRDAVVDFLGRAATVPLHQRVACLDNDGTLWCERPTYVQLDFFVDALRTAVGADPGLRDEPAFDALLSHDEHAIHELGLPRIAVALTSLFEGVPPDEFSRRVVEFMSTARHATLDRLHGSNRYQPMLELVAELRRLEFTVAVVTGGGTEFVRAVSQELYGVPPELVVGTLIEYEYGAEASGPQLRRSTRLVGGANEGPTKVNNIQTQLGRRPIFAAGNTAGDWEMLEWARLADGPTLALLVDHDDAEREFAYQGGAVSFTETEPITEIGDRLGWSIVSMAEDWATVFVEDGVT